MYFCWNRTTLCVSLVESCVCVSFCCLKEFQWRFVSDLCRQQADGSYRYEFTTWNSRMIICISLMTTEVNLPKCFWNPFRKQKKRYLREIQPERTTHIMYVPFVPYTSLLCILTIFDNCYRCTLFNISIFAEFFHLQHGSTRPEHVYICDF